MNAPRAAMHIPAYEAKPQVAQDHIERYLGEEQPHPGEYGQASHLYQHSVKLLTAELEVRWSGLPHILLQTSSSVLVHLPFLLRSYPVCDITTVPRRVNTSRNNG